MHLSKTNISTMLDTHPGAVKRLLWVYFFWSCTLVFTVHTLQLPLALPQLKNKLLSSLNLQLTIGLRCNYWKCGNTSTCITPAFISCFWTEISADFYLLTFNGCCNCFQGLYVKLRSVSSVIVQLWVNLHTVITLQLTVTDQFITLFFFSHTIQIPLSA